MLRAASFRRLVTLSFNPRKTQEDRSRGRCFSKTPSRILLFLSLSLFCPLPSLLTPNESLEETSQVSRLPIRYGVVESRRHIVYAKKQRANPAVVGAGPPKAKQKNKKQNARRNGFKNS
jgi:hypothetical protein